MNLMIIKGSLERVGFYTESIQKMFWKNHLAEAKSSHIQIIFVCLLFNGMVLLRRPQDFGLILMNWSTK